MPVPYLSTVQDHAGDDDGPDWQDVSGSIDTVAFICIDSFPSMQDEYFGAYSALSKILCMQTLCLH